VSCVVSEVEAARLYDPLSCSNRGSATDTQRQSGSSCLSSLDWIGLNWQGLIKRLTPVEEELVEIGPRSWAESVCKTISLVVGGIRSWTQLLSRVRKPLGVEVPLRSLFETPTIEAIAKYIEAVSWVTLVQTLESKMGERERRILTTVEFYLTCSSLDIQSVDGDRLRCNALKER